MTLSARQVLTRVALALAAIAAPLAPLEGQFGEAAAAGTGTGTFHALLIGVQNYPEHPGLIQLSHPLEHVTRLRRILIDRYDFDSLNITPLRDPDKATLLGAFVRLRKTLKRNDNLLVFFAGHGVFDEDLRLGYWLPSDAVPDDSVRTTWISNFEVVTQLASINVHHTLLISDACFSGSLFTMRDGPSIQADQEAWLARSSRRAITSGALNTVRDASPFLKSLLNTLASNTVSPLPSTRLYTSLVRTLDRTTQSRAMTPPQLGVLSNTGDAGGDFPFVLQPEETSTKAAEEREYASGPRRIYQHILVRLAGNSAADSAQARGRIAAIRVALYRGMTFAEAARRYSDDTLSAGERGFLPPYRKLPAARTPFQRAIANLEVDSVSGVIPTAGGLHLVRRPSLAEKEDYYATFVPSGEGGSAAQDRISDFMGLRERYFDQLSAGRFSPDLIEPKHELDAAERTGSGSHTGDLRRARDAFVEGKYAEADAIYRWVLSTAQKSDLTEQDLDLIKADLGLVQLRRAQAVSGPAAREIAQAAVKTLQEVVAKRGLVALEVRELLRTAESLGGVDAGAPSLPPPSVR